MTTKTPRDIRDRRERSKPTKKQKHTKRIPFDWKFLIGFVIGLLGLYLTIITIKARPTVSLEPPLDPHNVLTMQVVIQNETPFDFSGMKVASIARNITTSLTSVGTLASEWNTYPIPPDLKSGDTRTIPHPLSTIRIGGQMVSGQFGLLVSFSPKWLPFWERQEGFLFTIAVQSDGAVRFQQQPGEEIEEEYKKLQSERTFAP